MRRVRGSSGSGVPPRPRRSPLTAYDAVWLVVLNAGVVTFMWVRHGGLNRSRNLDEWLVSLGQLSGLYAGLAVLVALVMMSRAPWLERRYGLDQMARVHRWTGFTAAWLIGFHVLTTTIGLAGDTGISLWDQVVDYVRTYPYLVNAMVAFGLFIVVVVTSIRVLRQRLSYETWWFVHLLTYVAVALSFGHQTAIGADFVLDSAAFAYWVLLYASVAFLILGYRWVALFVRLIRHRSSIAAVVPRGPDVVSLVIEGRGLDRLATQAGQFFMLRILAKGRWWKAHPFSLSAPPDGGSLQFTVKAFGDDTRLLQSIPPGTRVAIEGPYGGFLDVFPTKRRMFFIAGGIGITPFRGLIDDIDRPADVTLLYRSPRPADAVFRQELESLSEARGFGLHMSYSRTPNGSSDPFAPSELLRIVPDVAEREVFIIGSPRLVAAARRGLRLAGVPGRQIHRESFTY